MPDANDMDLLREFARNNSQTAFAELVRRHLNLVYSVARRCTGNDGDAQDVAQAVFIILARKAASLRAHTLLTGWLYETTRFTAARLLRTNTRRQQREQEAYMQSTLNDADASEVWKKVSPHLETAMSQLAERDRTLLVLRFYKNKSGPETAALLGIREDAAHKRTARAIEKLRQFFAKHGVTFSAAAIMTAVSANSIQAAPVALTKTISAVAMTKGATATASILTLVTTTMKTMTWMKLKFAVGAGLAIVLLGATTTLLAQRDNSPSAIIPYKTLDDASRFADGFDQSKLVVRVLIASHKRGVRPADIHFTIKTDLKGTIPVKLGAKGQIVNFPDDATLRRENPSIISDQPKGTLNMGVWCYLPMPNSLNFPYSRLSDAVAEANKGIERANDLIKTEYAGQVSPIKGTAQGVVFVFAKASAGKAKIEIAAAAGKKEYTADAHGNIRIEMEPALVAENPEVTLSEKAQYVVPDHLPWPSEKYTE